LRRPSGQRKLQKQRTNERRRIEITKYPVRFFHQEITNIEDVLPLIEDGLTSILLLQTAEIVKYIHATAEDCLLENSSHEKNVELAKIALDNETRLRGIRNDLNHYHLKISKIIEDFDDKKIEIVGTDTRKKRKEGE
jgi:hypothetical protein